MARSAMPLDYSEVAIGPPGRVIGELTARLGYLNYSSYNIKVGITSNPADTFRAMTARIPWSVLKLLYVTRSASEAQEMADLLRAWDGKLFQPGPQPEGDEPEPLYYAYVVILERAPAAA